MSHFAVISPPFYSHVRALQALAQSLVARGHRITFVQQTDVAALLNDPRIGFHAVGLATHPAGALDHTLQLAAHPGEPGILRLIRDTADSTDMLCRQLPLALRSLGIDGVIVDQMTPAGGLVAEDLRLPFVSVACALPINREAHFPLPVMPFLWGTDAAAREHYTSSEKIYDWLMRRHDRVLARHAEAFGLAGPRQPHQCLSPLALISQLPQPLDFPCRALPEHFHAAARRRAVRDAAVRRQRSAAHFCLARHAAGRALRPVRNAGESLPRAGRRAAYRLLRRPERFPGAQVATRRRGDYPRRTQHRARRHRQRHAAARHPAGLQSARHCRAASAPPGYSRFATSHQLTRHLRHLLEEQEVNRCMAALPPQLAHCGGVERAAEITERALLTRQPVRAEKSYDIAV